MTTFSSVKWFKLHCKSSELQLLGTLNGGQSFSFKQWNTSNLCDLNKFPCLPRLNSEENGWKKIIQDTKEQWIGVFAKKVWILQQVADGILYQVYEAESEKNPAYKQTEETYNKLLNNYLNLDVKLSEYYLKWSDQDPNFKEAAKQFHGIRILRQDVTENIFSFICSQNNHISRITNMVEKLAVYYGDKICDINDVSYYTFPEVEKLATESVEQKLRGSGFGYRAKYISSSAKLIVEGGGKKWLNELEKMKYEDARTRLMSLMGIGAKVADCICLMSLGHLQAIPVDTHIYQIAARLYMPKLAKQKTITPKIYDEIGDHFRQLYGPLAGWAHTVLFCADLKKFKIDKAEEKKGTNCKKQKTK